MKKNSFMTILIIIAVMIIAYFIISSGSQTPDEQVAKCIGENAILYVQLGCHACEIQEEMFGENLNHLKIVDCFYDRKSCSEIEVTPTWKINGNLYKGVKSIDELKELTGC